MADSFGINNLRTWARSPRVELPVLERGFFSLANPVAGFLNVILALLAICALIAVMYGGYMYMTSLGDEAKTKEAKMIILWAILGILVVGASYVGLLFIGNVFFA